MSDVDLDPDSRRALDFDALLGLVAAHAATPPGRRSVLETVPSADARGVREAIETVREADRLLDVDGRLVPAALPDPEPALEPLAIEGARVEAAVLRDLAVVLDAASDLGRRLRALDPEAFPRLSRLGIGLPDLAREAGTVLRAIEPDGTVTDEASPELARIRRRSATVGGRLRRSLEATLHGPGSAGVVQDAFVTQRNGRFVIPIRADAPRAARGIVHASSSSGATLFVEPFESVELNNELVRLAEREAEEIERILRDRSERLRRRLPEVRTAIEGLASADGVQARALYGRSADAVAADVAPGSMLELRAVRHPVLDHRLRLEGAASVPVDVALDPFDRVLVISGPNAGGKTVALKTLGLAVLAAQSGIPVPAARARVPLYRQVRADIGDHQSIAADLSTFSAHVRSVSRFLGEIEPPSLLMFDEIGTGTDPAEGAALAQAVLEGLMRPGVTAAATTHHGVLKSWAFSSPGAVSAAMEFDEATLRPTFRVRMGEAGVSAGIEIAARLGLSDGVVSRSRALLGDSAGRAERYLARLRSLTDEAAAARDAAAEARAGIERERREQEERTAAEIERARREAAARLDEVLAGFRDDARRLLAGIDDARAREIAAREAARAERRLRGESAGLRSRLERRERPAAEVALEPGRRVRVRSLDRDAEVVAVRDGKIEVRFGGIGMTVEREDLEPSGSAPPSAPATRRTPRPRPAGREGDDLAAEAPHELLLLGRTVDEALPEIDRFLDRAALAGRTEVRIVHGHGTGRLRSAVRGYLERHPHAAAHRPGRPEEGGDGATVVTLR